MKDGKAEQCKSTKNQKGLRVMDKAGQCFEKTYFYNSYETDDVKEIRGYSYSKDVS